MTIGKEDETRERDILPFLLMIENERTVTAADVNSKFLMVPESHIFGGRWLFAMHNYNLIEPAQVRASAHPNYTRDAFQLTDLGEEMARTRKIMVPEYGEYTIHLTDDVLIKDEWLACQPNKDTTPHQEFEEIKRSSRQNNAVSQSIQIEPSDIDGWKGKAIPLPAQNMSYIRIINVEEKVAPSKNKIDVEIKVVLTEDGKKFVRVINGDSNVIYTQEFKIDYQDVLIEILNANGMLYDEKTSTVLLNKKQITKEIVRQGAVKVLSTEIDLEDLGKFISSGLDLVPAQPVDLQAASVWTQIDIEQRIRDYITSDEYKELQREVADTLTPRFAVDKVLDQMPTLKDRVNEMLKSQRGRDADYWHIVAPYDLVPLRSD
ncbi:MAG: hypothetical protein LLG16_07340 [Euryarchaeota archaeon]|nr:hypothetical protein [Euryarchaeota archaeon]